MIIGQDREEKGKVRVFTISINPKKTAENIRANIEIESCFQMSLLNLLSFFTIYFSFYFCFFKWDILFKQIYNLKNSENCMLQKINYWYESNNPTL